MKKSKKKFFLLLGMLLLIAVFAFSACEKKPDDNPSDNGKTDDNTLLTFVAADKTSWDKEVTLGGKKFTLSLELLKDNTLVLSGTCVGEAASGGGGFPGMQAATNESAEEPNDEETKDFSAYNFTVGGTWTEEKGWGYTLKFADDGNTEIKADYDLTMGRHVLYYYMAPTIDGQKANETLVQFQAKDSAYRKSLDKNYVTYAEKNMTYMFHGGGFDATTGNKAEVKLYLLKNGGIACYSESGSELTYIGKGSWTEDKTNHVITVVVDGKEMTTNAYCETAGREGYRMNYSTGRTSLETFCPVADGMTWDMYNDSDFDGSELFTLSGGDYTLMFTSKNFAILKNGNSKIETYVYEIDSEGNYVVKGGKVKVIKEDFFNPEIETSDAVSVKEDETLTITVTVGVQNGPSKKYTDVVLTGKDAQ